MKLARSAVVVFLAVLCMAPTAGDVGGCGQDAVALDVDAYALARKDADCARCKECSLSSARCTRACDSKAAPETSIPATCHPLEHDGEVCLRALHAASCEAYGRYLSDVAPESPSECAFCVSDGGMP